VRGPLLFFLVPAAVTRTVARRAPLRGAAAFVSQPSVALAAWAAVYAAWHVPAAYGFALGHGTAHVAEHACFAAVGFLVWTQLVDPARRGRLSTGGRLALAGAVFACAQVLGDQLLLARSPLYAAYPDVGDQQLAGIVMMVEQVATLGVCAVLLVRSGFRRAARLAAAV
jgi:cytochrome c oxidase assembly factor CtaG